MGAARPFTGRDPERYLFESHKRVKNRSSKPIPRQQACYALQLAMERAGIDPEHFETHPRQKTSAAKMMEPTKHIDVVRDWLGHRNSATTYHYLKSDNRERLATPSR